MTTQTEIYNYSSIRDKLFNNLVSIIDGILADDLVDKAEVVFLDNWLAEAQQISSNSTVKSLVYKVESVLVSGMNTQDLIDLKASLHAIQRELLDLPGIDFYSIDADVNLLLGLCKGIAADKKISDSEVRYLDWWLAQNSMLRNNYPGKGLHRLVSEILSDGIITPEESKQLYEAVNLFSGASLEDGVTDGMATRLPCDVINDLNLDGQTFCLTGEFIMGRRTSVESLIKKHGGRISDSITKKTNFLVVGTLSSRDWKFSSHGRKIEKAIEYRDIKISGIKIIGEDDLIKFLPTS